VKVEPASEVLYEEMHKLGFEEIMPFLRAESKRAWICLC